MSTFEPPDPTGPLPPENGLDRALLWRWVGANAVALFGGFVASSLYLGIGLSTAFGGPGGNFVAALLFILLAGGLLGLLQWLVLRMALPIGRVWAPATMLALAIRLPAAVLARWTLLDTLLAPIGRTSQDLSGGGFLLSAALAALFVGLALGIVQWLLLRAHLRRSGLWILANTVALPASLPAFFLLGLPFGLLTGLVLVWLLRNRRAA